MLVLVGGEKGGVGKTTVAANLAAMRARAGHDVLLLDADRQGSANLWASIREEEGVTPKIPCMQKRGKALAANIRDLANRYSDIIIDAGGHDSVELRAALTVVHLAVFPIQPSLFDQYFGKNLGGLVVNNAIVTKRFVIRAGFFQTLPIG
jgi:chromosome partitioning protein